MKRRIFTRSRLALTILVGTPGCFLLSGCATQSSKNPALYNGGLSAITENTQREIDASDTSGGTAMGGLKPKQKKSATERLMSPLKQASAKKARTKEYAEDPLSLTNETTALSADLFLSAARVIASSGNYENAKKLYHDALTAYPNHREGMLELARIHVQLKEYDEATDVYLKVVEAHPEDPVVFNDVAMYHMEQERLPMAIKNFQRAVQLDPNKVLYRNNLANAYVKNGQPQLAFPQLAAVHTESVAHFNLGYLLYNHKQLGASIAEFDQAFQADTQYYDAYVMRMRVMEELNRLEQTQQHMQQIAPANFQGSTNTPKSIRQTSAIESVEPESDSEPSSKTVSLNDESVSKIPAYPQTDAPSFKLEASTSSSPSSTSSQRREMKSADQFLKNEQE